MKRYQQQIIEKDLSRKMVFLTGPRQVGKTWLAKQIAQSHKNSVYLNYDHFEDRKIIESENWLPSAELLVLDELHKMPGWKNYLKGVYDTKPEHLSLLVTGSARLETFRQHGDSLAGRYFLHRLLPLSPDEIVSAGTDYNIDDLMKRSGFPEPFLAENETEAQRWRMQYNDSLIRQDILDFENIHDYRAMQHLVELLKHRVGSPVSYTSLSEDLSISPNTVKKYITILESLYVVFLVRPCFRNIARSIRKEPKVYFFDTGMVADNSSASYENMTALNLLKFCYLREDSTGLKTELQYVRTKDGEEVDFCITEDQQCRVLVEAKLSDSDISKSLRMFSDKYSLPGVQVVLNARHERKEADIEVRRAKAFFEELCDNLESYLVNL
jgi:predicted AAA+ superfamily ATPase